MFTYVRATNKSKEEWKAKLNSDTLAGKTTWWPSFGSRIPVSVHKGIDVETCVVYDMSILEDFLQQRLIKQEQLIKAGQVRV